MGVAAGEHRHSFRTQERAPVVRDGTTSFYKVEECRICQFVRITTVVEKEGNYGAVQRHRRNRTRV